MHKTYYKDIAFILSSITNAKVAKIATSFLILEVLSSYLISNPFDYSFNK